MPKNLQELEFSIKYQRTKRYPAAGEFIIVSVSQDRGELLEFNTIINLMTDAKCLDFSRNEPDKIKPEDNFKLYIAKVEDLIEKDGEIFAKIINHSRGSYAKKTHLLSADNAVVVDVWAIPTTEFEYVFDFKEVTTRKYKKIDASTGCVSVKDDRFVSFKNVVEKGCLPDNLFRLSPSDNIKYHSIYLNTPTTQTQETKDTQIELPFEITSVSGDGVKKVIQDNMGNWLIVEMDESKIPQLKRFLDDHSFVVAVDFDTVLTRRNGNELEFMPDCEKVLNQLSGDKVVFIVWSCRSGDKSDAIIDFFKANPTLAIYSYGVNFTPRCLEMGAIPRKILADIYLDGNSIDGFKGWKWVYRKLYGRPIWFNELFKIKPKLRWSTK